MLKKYDYLIVGSGLFGATCAFRATNAGKKCLVIDKRNHLGGNVFCENIEGINVHKYGAHIFHTSNENVWNFVNSFVQFNRYTNSPLANYKGKLYNLPFNMNTFYQLWGATTPSSAYKIINEQKKEAKAALYGREPVNLEEQALILVGKDIYEKIIKEYTEKQWGRKCSELPTFIIKRLPIRFSFDNNYFNDKYQGVPIGGYNKLIECLLSNVECRLNVNFFDNRKELESLADTIIFTGRIDEFYNYSFGKLEFRSLKFEEEILNIANYQGNAVINFTEKKIPYTRIIEHKHFEFFNQDVYNINKTIITKEYPVELNDCMEPYYPINDARNSNIADKYKSLASQEKNVIFGGRLAEYKYYDMAPIIEKALKIDLKR